MTTGGPAAPARAGGGVPPGAVVPVADLPGDSVVVGRVDGAYGVRGELRVEPFNDPQDSVLLRVRRWYLVAPAPRSSGQAGASSPGASGRGVRPFPLPAMVEVSRCRVHAAGLVATVSGIEIKEVADALRGCEIAV